MHAVDRITAAKASRLTALIDAHRVAAARAADALTDVANHPVANAEELFVKIVYLNEVGAWDASPVAACISVDVRRLDGEA